jgi:hypothetical protein
MEMAMDGSGFTVWWMLAAFVLGGMSGVLVMALMCLSAGLPRKSTVSFPADWRGFDESSRPAI